MTLRWRTAHLTTWTARSRAQQRATSRQVGEAREPRRRRSALSTCWRAAATTLALANAQTRARRVGGVTAGQRCEPQGAREKREYSVWTIDKGGGVELTKGTQVVRDQLNSQRAPQRAQRTNAESNRHTSRSASMVGPYAPCCRDCASSSHPRSSSGLGPRRSRAGTAARRTRRPGSR